MVLPAMPVKKNLHLLIPCQIFNFQIKYYARCAKASVKKKETKQSKYNFIIMSKFTLSKLLSE